MWALIARTNGLRKPMPADHRHLDTSSIPYTTKLIAMMYPYIICHYVFSIPFSQKTTKNNLEPISDVLIFELRKDELFDDLSNLVDYALPRPFNLLKRLDEEAAAAAAEEASKETLETSPQHGLKRKNAFLDDDHEGHADGYSSPVNENNNAIPERVHGVGHAAPVTPWPPIDSDEELTKSEKKRRNSRAWHAKWVKKGVLRSDPNAAEAAPSTTEEAPEPVQADVPPPVENDGRSTSSNMREACAKFVKEWIEKSNLPPSQERVLKARQAWMNSEDRSAMLAGRKKVQK